MCCNRKKLASSAWLRYGRALAQVLNLSMYAFLLPNKTLTQCFCAVHALVRTFLCAAPHTEIQYVRCDSKSV